MMWIGYVGAGVFAAAGVTLLLLAPAAHQPGDWASRCAPTLGPGRRTRRRVRVELLSVRVAWRVGTDEMKSSPRQR